jgi:hypothetical protein
MAALIVVFPVFLFLSRWLNRQMATDPTRKELKIYKWLVYFTLFISAITIIVDLITLIYNFLGGELTARFGLKVLVVLIVGLGIFGYYLWHLRSDMAAVAGKRRGLFWFAIAMMLISLGLSFVIAGSPATARKQKLDQQKVQELQNTQWQIQDEYNRTQKLPPTVQMYEYHVTGASTYQLCEEFNLPTVTQPTQDPWWHDAGHFCYDLDAKSIPNTPKRPAL